MKKKYTSMLFEIIISEEVLLSSPIGKGDVFGDDPYDNIGESGWTGYH